MGILVSWFSKVYLRKEQWHPSKSIKSTDKLILRLVNKFNRLEQNENLLKEEGESSSTKLQKPKIMDKFSKEIPQK